MAYEFDYPPTSFSSPTSTNSHTFDAAIPEGLSAGPSARSCSQTIAQPNLIGLGFCLDYS